jgi:LPS-assembly lipoprotein
MTRQSPRCIGRDVSRRAVLIHWASWMAVLPAAASLAACGFQLRQTPEFAFKSIYTNVSTASVLGIELKRHLRAMGNVVLITDPALQKNAQVILDVLQELREKSVVGMNAAGQVREFQLRIRFKYRLRTPAGKEIIEETELLRQQDISFSESAVLSKEVEEAQLYRSMQNDIVQQLLRRLAAVKEAAFVD